MKTTATERERWNMGVGRAMQLLGPVVAIPSVERALSEEELEAIRVLGRSVVTTNSEQIAENNEALT